MQKLPWTEAQKVREHPQLLHPQEHLESEEVAAEIVRGKCHDFSIFLKTKYRLAWWLRNPKSPSYRKTVCFPQIFPTDLYWRKGQNNEAWAKVWRKTGKGRKFLTDRFAATKELKSHRTAEVEGSLTGIEVSQLQGKNFQSTGWHHREQVNQYSDSKRHEEERGTSPISKTLSYTVGNVLFPPSNLGKSYWSINSILTFNTHSIAQASPHEGLTGKQYPFWRNVVSTCFLHSLICNNTIQCKVHGVH